jgi:hypothetical protein
MAYISPIAVETALRSIDEMAPEASRHNQATEAAHVLLATSRRHAVLPQPAASRSSTLRPASFCATATPAPPWATSPKPPA